MADKPQLLSLFLLFFFLSLTSTTTSQTPPSFKCTGTTAATCRALVGYVSPNSTTLAHIQSLFQVKTLRTLLGVNNLPVSTPPSYPVAAKQTVKIPFPCHCINGTGLSNKVPKYTVVNDGLGLYHIANDVFSGLVAYQQIQAVNHIVNANLIKAGQELWVPLPCSCDDVDGEKVVHYGHVVASGSSVDEIAAEFGTTSETLMKLNGISDPKKLIAGQVLDVPLKACSSSINSTSPDYRLLVANGTTVFTANNCVMCKCDAANNYTLQCQESGLKPANWPACPPMQCPSSSLSIGNSTISGCSRSTCAYAGYSNQTILTSLVVDNTCPAPAADSSNEASKIHLRGWRLLALVSLTTFQLLIMLHTFL